MIPEEGYTDATPEAVLQTLQDFIQERIPALGEVEPEGDRRWVILKIHLGRFFIPMKLSFPQARLLADQLTVCSYTTEAERTLMDYQERVGKGYLDKLEAETLPKQ